MANEFKTKNGLITQTLSVQSANNLQFYNLANTFYTAFKAGSPTANVIWTLPSTDATGTQALVSNGSGTLSWQTLSGSGTVTSVSGTGTVSGITLTGTVTTTGSLTLGGALSLVSPPPIGSTTPNTGAFTTLSASSTVSGTGFTTYLASPPTIGNTTPNTGTFTNISSATSPTNTVPALALTGTPGGTAAGKTGVFGLGPNVTISDKNIMATFSQSINDYTQLIIQNPNTGTAASTDIVLNNDNTTGTGTYVDLGINSSTYTGTGSFNTANNTYFYTIGGDLVIGTQTANIVRFAIGSSTAADAGTITSTGLNAFPIGATTAAAGTFSTLTFSGTTTNLTATAQTTGLITIGGTAGTGALTFGSSTASQTTNIANGVTASGNTNTINIGTAGATGSTTSITIGSASGTSTVTANGTLNDSIGNVRTIVQNAQAGATSYTLLATDAGKHIYLTGTGGVTCPVSVFTVGQAITIVNNTAASIIITAPAAGTLYLAGTASTGNRTLAQRGVATLLYVVGGATPSIISSGAGLT